MLGANAAVSAWWGLTRCLSLGLQVLLENVVGGPLLAPVPDDSAGALDDLPGLALLVDLAQTGPLAQLHVGVDLDEGDVVLHAEGGDQLLVHGLVAVLGENAQQSLTFVKSLSCLPESSCESVGDEGVLQHLGDSGVDVHRTRRHDRCGDCGGIISLDIRHVEFLDELAFLKQITINSTEFL